MRAVLVAEQQRAGAGGGVVMEGRDIGTVVFPDAELKIFLEASPEVRAERRWKEHQEKGEPMTLAQVLEEVRERDKRDRERKVSPLVRAADAVLVDNTAMDAAETARLIVMLAHERERELATAAGSEATMIRMLASCLLAIALASVMLVACRCSPSAQSDDSQPDASAPPV